MKWSILLFRKLTPLTVKTVLFLLLCPVLLWAQTVRITPDDLIRKQSYLLLRDGSVVRGQILRQDSSLITVRQRGKVLTFVEADQLVRVLPSQPGEPAPVTPSPATVFVLKDGSRVEGTFLRRDSTMITVRKRDGRLTYFEPELLVRTDSMPVETPLATSTNRTFSNQFSPWLLTGPTAYNPEKGRFYYRNTGLILNEFDYGITRHWSVGASFITPIPYAIYADAYYGWTRYLTTNSRLFTKVSVPLGQGVRLGLNATYQVNQQYVYVGSPRGTLTFQALATAGSRERNVTVGYGIAVPKGKYTFYYAPSPPTPRTINVPNQMFLTLGIVQRVSRNVTFISDNRVNVGSRYTFYINEQLTASAALRLNRRRHAFDLGLLSFVYEELYLGDGKRVRLIPYVGYNVLIN